MTAADQQGVVDEQEVGRAVTPPTTRSADDEAGIQAQIALVRAQLLGGRGADVSQTEIDEHTRARIVLDGEPTAQHLAAVAEQTAVVSGDTAAIALDVAAARAHRDATTRAATQACRDQADPRVPVRRFRLSHPRQGRGWLVLSVIVFLIIRRHARTSGDVHHDRRTG